MMGKLMSGVIVGSMLGAAIGVYASAMTRPELMQKKARRMWKTGKKSMRRYAHTIGLM